MHLKIMPQQWKKYGISSLVAVIFNVSLLMGGLSAYPLVTSAANAQSAGIEIELKQGSDTALVNGKEIKVQEMYETKGVTMIPVRVLMNAFELTIQFFNSAHEKSFTLNSKSYRDYSALVKLGALEAQVGGKVVKLPQPAVEKQGSFMVPLRVFAESLEAAVKFDSKNKTIRITRAADILVDGKHRIGSSKDSWSIAAPLYNPGEPTPASWFGFETHPGAWNWSGSLNANPNTSFNVTIWTDDGGKPLTDDEALEQLKKQIHTSWFTVQKRTLKTNDGSFIGFVAGHNEPFSVTYSQFWILRLPEKTYYIEIFIGNGSVEKHKWVADQLLPTFRASFDDKDANSKDVTLLKQQATN
ncbi:stalk domain-containing protein [Paenibacillus sp. JDR-2]|uniref:stalk domain-containing protein n=1 Tax=Paenibacillus sp. (strain JDR-2) TaxID=324057 RepID=UPI000166A4CB|nr:stalk domain-containing protein [Paenibacillus sp. JDR-2]ACT00296.1 copper amine oxidase domain protein [Paenibacillus sp. JDR-2]